jgi:hypothetical protein
MSYEIDRVRRVIAAAVRNCVHEMRSNLIALNSPVSGQCSLLADAALAESLRAAASDRLRLPDVIAHPWAGKQRGNKVKERGSK